MSDELARSCLVILVVILHMRFERSDWKMDSKSSIRFLKDLDDEPPTCQELPEYTGEFFQDICWDIRSKPWHARASDGGFIRLGQVLFDQPISLLVGDYYDKGRAITPVHGLTVYSVLNAVHEFYYNKKARFEQTRMKGDPIHGCSEHAWYIGNLVEFAGLSKMERPNVWLLNLKPWREDGAWKNCPTASRYDSTLKEPKEVVRSPR